MTVYTKILTRPDSYAIAFHTVIQAFLHVANVIEQVLIWISISMLMALLNGVRSSNCRSMRKEIINRCGIDSDGNAHGCAGFLRRNSGISTGAVGIGSA